MDQQAREEVDQMVQELFGPQNVSGPPNCSTQPGDARPTVPTGTGSTDEAQVMAIDNSTVSELKRADLGINHIQCCTARAVNARVELFSLATNQTFGTAVMSEPAVIGHLNVAGDELVAKTFHAARAKRGGDFVNQSVTITFDPNYLSCLSCPNEHPIVDGQGKPTVGVVCDQNFVSMWPGTDPNNCVWVVRVVNPSMHELTDFLFEIFDRKCPPDGSVILVGSVSHLARVGVSCYSREWTQVVHRFGRRWPNVKVAPLVPLLREDSPGGLSRELVLLATWLFKVYSDSLVGLRSCWHKLIQKCLERSVGHTPLASHEFFTIPLPAGIDPSSPDRPTSFYTNSSRPSLLRGLDKGSVDELLGSISEMVSRDFSVPVSASPVSASAVIGDGVQANIKRLVLVGASNLRAIVGMLQAEGYETVDLTVPGWCVSPENVSELLAKLKNISLSNNTAVVFDLFGNSCTRVAIFDGSTSLPNKSAGGYHLKGEIVVCNDDIFDKLSDVVLPLFEMADSVPIVVFPPQPRYLFNGCCNDDTHCTNLKKEGFSESMLKTTIKLRTLLKKKLESKRSGPYRVMDTCAAVPEPAAKSVNDKLTELPAVSAKDGVHLTKVGYVNMTANLVHAIGMVQEGHTGKIGSAAVSYVTGSGRHHWRGFTSPVGSKLAGHQHGMHKWERSRPHHNHGPYMFKKFNKKHVRHWSKTDFILSFAF